MDEKVSAITLFKGFFVVLGINNSTTLSSTELPEIKRKC
jgi:hypothetical protein